MSSTIFKNTLKFCINIKKKIKIEIKISYNNKKTNNVNKIKLKKYI